MKCIKGLIITSLAVYPILGFTSTLETHHLPFNVSIKAPSNWYVLTDREVHEVANRAKDLVADPMVGKKRLLAMSNSKNNRLASLRVVIETDTVLSEDFIRNLSEGDINEMEYQWQRQFRNSPLQVIKFNSIEVNRKSSPPSITMSYIRKSLVDEKGKWFVKMKQIPMEYGNLILTTSHSLSEPHFSKTFQLIERTLKFTSSISKKTNILQKQFERIVKDSVVGMRYPQQVDHMTYLVNIYSLPEKWLEYSYRINRPWREVFGENRFMNIDEKISIRDDACSNPGIREVLKMANGVVYTYTDANNDISKVYITCR